MDLRLVSNSVEHPVQHQFEDHADETARQEPVTTSDYGLAPSFDDEELESADRPLFATDERQPVKFSFLQFIHVPLSIAHYLRTSKEYLDKSTFLQRNTGLLLVALLQLFFALMHTCVKLFSTLDPPISALEVCTMMHLLNHSDCTYQFEFGFADI